jgi:NodT family efflux transporter outer membrane factor (OMF) lipoprotein
MTPALLIALAAAPVNTPLPPTAAGNAPPSVLIAPIAPEGGPAQRVIPASPVPARWWSELGSAKLNALVEQSRKASTDIAAADATLRQAQELARAAGGGQLPQVDASYQATRARVSNTVATPLSDPGATLYTLHTAQVSVSYTLDVFGGIRAKVRSARAAATAQRWRTRAAHTTVIANLVQAIVQNAALSDQIAAREAIANNTEILTLIRRRMALGAVGAADVAAQETALAMAQGALPPLERAQKHQQALIAILTGVPPGTPLPALPTLDELTLPAQVPLTLPAQTVAHRPDVQAAAAQMEGAAADAKAALAARLPSFTLAANYGGSSNRFADMFATGNPFWAVLGGVTQPIFHAGSLLHQSHAAQAALEASKAQYRGTVLQAFADVSDALTALKTDGDALEAATRGDRASAQSLTFTRRQFELGAIGTYQLLPIAAARAQARSAWVQARAARLGDTVALYQALGGAPD